MKPTKNAVKGKTFYFPVAQSRLRKVITIDITVV